MSGKRAKAASAFTLDNYDISLHLLVSFYIHYKKFGHHLGTKALNFDVIFSALKGKNVSIYKFFYDVMSFYG